MPSYMNSYHAHSLLRKFQRNKYEKKYADLIQKNKDKKILVILHMFYPQSWKEIKEYLLNFAPYNWELVITHPTELKEKLPLDEIALFKEGTRFYDYPNRGYDIAPFMRVLKEIDLDAYDIVFKLQSKGVKRKAIFIYKQLFFGRDWFLNLYEGCVGAKGIHKTIDVLCDKTRKEGVACAANLAVKDPIHKQHLVEKTLKNYNLPFVPNYDFIAGTCYAIRPEHLKEFKDMPYSDKLYDNVLSSRGMSYAHVLERYYTISTQIKNVEIYKNEVLGFRRALKRPLEKFMYRFSSERLHETNYVIDDEYFLWGLDNRFVIYKERECPVGRLKWHKHKDRDYFIKDCVPYRYLCGDTESYNEYREFHEKNGFPYMTADRFDALIKSMDDSGYNENSIILVDDRFALRDGQHRACYLAYKYGLDHKVKILQISNINKSFLIKCFIPKPIKIRYFKKEYGCY